MSLYPFQINGVCFMKDVLTHHSGVFLADEMGLGKTIQALYLMKGLDRVNNGLRYLIVCPKSLTTVWKTQAEKWIGKQIGIFKKGVPIEGSLIINYDIVAANIDSLLAAQFHVLICDEAHRLKNEKTSWTVAINNIAKNIRDKSGKVIIITGTPVLNAIRELYSQQFIIGNPLGMSYTEFALKFCNRHLVCRFKKQLLKDNFCKYTRHNCTGRCKSAKLQYDDNGVSNAKVLKKLLSTFMIRRKIKEVLPQLPKVITSVLLFPKNNKIDVRTNYFISNINSLSDVSKIMYSNKETNESFSTLRREQAITKLPLCIDYFKDVLMEKQKIVIFAYHIEVQEKLIISLKEYGITFITGELSDEQRLTNVYKFQNDPATRVIIVSMKAGFEGLTLTAASFCAFVELLYTPDGIAQCIARLHRITQTQTVQAVFLFQEGSIDGHIVNLVVKKENIINQVFEK